MNLEEQQKIQELYLDLINLDKSLKRVMIDQDSYIKAIPVSNLEDAIRMTARAINGQIIIKSILRDKTYKLHEIREELEQTRRNIPK